MVPKYYDHINRRICMHDLIVTDKVWFMEFIEQAMQNESQKKDKVIKFFFWNFILP